MKRLVRNMAMCLVAALVAWAMVPAASAATVRLKDGRVLEGRITKEGEGFLFLMISVGGLEHQEIITSEQIKSIDRDDSPPAADPKAEAAIIPSRETLPKDAAKPAGEKAVSPGATRIAFISLEEEVGPYMFADALLHSKDILDKLPEDERPQIVVLKFNSGGGAGSEMHPFSDAIHLKLKADYRVVGWIESAISAASFTAWNCEELYFRSHGNFGGNVGFYMTGPGQAKAVEGDTLEWSLQLGEMVAKRGGYNPLIMRAMQTLTPISCDIDEDGLVTWYEGTSGDLVVNPPDRILTLNSELALKCKVSKGTADTKDQLAKLLGCKEWVEVGQEADEYQIAFREAVHEAEARTDELISKMNIAIQFGQAPRARTFLEELRSIARRAPSMAKYGNPPLSKEWFEEVEKQLRKIIDDQEKMKRRER
ncbi:MAG TPA: hypothetical protein VG797_01250 [Phycisphaerales bacterium]|nr:hypothetical protein [Phycisphaerales bacterium]